MNTDLPGSQDANDMQAMVYKYDQLHRLVQARSLRAYTTSFTHRSASAVTVNAYDANYTYDGNGNLLTLQRRNAAAAIQEDGALRKCPVDIFSDGPGCRGGPTDTMPTPTN
jgi:YD repeat-containing protein